MLDMLTIDFFITSLIVVLIPGTGVIYTVSTGLFFGSRASIAAAAGCTLGIIPHLFASILGLSAIFHTSAIVFQVVKYAGVLYLLYLAISMWKNTGALQLNHDDDRKNLRQILTKAVFINILNPKLTLFFLAFLPLFITPNALSPLFEMLLLSAIFMTMTLGVFILYGIGASHVRTHVINSPGFLKWLQRTFAAIFAALGLKLAITDS